MSMDTTNWDQLSGLEGLQPVIDPHDRKGAKNFLIDLMQWNALRKHLRSSKKLLDFGCGIGRYAQRIHKLGIDYIGIDPSLGMIRRAGELNGKEFFRHFDGSRIPFPDNSFDTVVTSEVLTYFLKGPNISSVLTEIQRVLVPKGRLVMIEQASISGRKSESANTIVTEDDYRRALSGRFDIRQFSKVRSPDFSNFTCRILESPKVSLSLFKPFAWLIAGHESKLVAKATDDYFKTTSYYEFLVDAQVIKHK